MLIPSLVAVITLFAVYAIAISYLHFVRNPLPWPDWGNAGFVLPSKEARQAVINVLREFGLSPDVRVDTTNVSRAIYHSKFPFILDVTIEEIARKVGDPQSFVSIVVVDPPSSANRASRLFNHFGFESNTVHDPDQDLPANKLSVVTSDACPGKMLVFRQHMTKMGPKPPKWTDD